MVAVCVIAGTLHWALDADTFTLAWTHSIEKVRWEEDYRLEGATLVLEEARIHGSGAGMEPPPDAVLRDGVWHYRPADARFLRVLLANSPFGGHYDICMAGRCRALRSTLGAATAPTVIEPCMTDR
jgi:hypothetical protein